MEVGNGFATVLCVVDDDAESIFPIAFLPGDVPNPQKKVAEKFLIADVRFGNPGDGFLWDEKKVNRSLGRDIAEAKAEVVFVNDVRRDFPGDDFFKEGHGRI